MEMRPRKQFTLYVSFSTCRGTASGTRIMRGKCQCRKDLMIIVMINGKQDDICDDICDYKKSDMVKYYR